MEVIDYTKRFNIPVNNCGTHAYIFPKHIFCVIAGSTGSGKTNLMVNLLLQKGIVNYGDIYVYSSTLHQPAYVYLKDCFELFEKLIKTKTTQSVKLAHFYDKDDDLVDPSKLSKDQNHIMIFDDVMMSDQTAIKKYFCSGRHNNVNVFYLVQSLHKIAKHCIRENANTFILFRQDDKTLKYFHETHIAGDMDFKEFKTFCDNAWNKTHGFVVINIWDDPYCGRYWDNYTNIFIPSKFKS
jgi:hypothetical protein